MLWLRLLSSVTDTIACGIALGVFVLGVVRFFSDAGS